MQNTKKIIIMLVAVIVAVAALAGLHMQQVQKQHREELQKEIKKLTYNTNIDLKGVKMTDEEMLQFLKAREKCDKSSNSYNHKDKEDNAPVYAKRITLWKKLPSKNGKICFRYKGIFNGGYYNIYNAEVSRKSAKVTFYKSMFEIQDEARQKTEDEWESKSSVPSVPSDDELSELKNSDDMKYRNE